LNKEQFAELDDELNDLLARNEVKALAKLTV
jgi:hypothetical protein